MGSQASGAEAEVGAGSAGCMARHRQGCSVAQAETKAEGLNFSAAPKEGGVTALSHNTLNHGCTASYQH